MTVRVFVTGMGCLSGLAQGVEATWARLTEGFDPARPFVREGRAGTNRVEGMAIAMDAPDTGPFADRFNVRLLEQMDPSSAYGVLAAFEALSAAGLLDDPERLQKAGVLMGSGGGGLISTEQSYERLFIDGARNMHPLTIPKQLPSAPASQVSIMFSTQGPCFGIASACAASSHAIAEGLAMIRSGRAELVIAGGAEAPLTLGSFLAWQSLRVLAKTRCRPFSSGRDGMMLGEGAAVIVLESEAHMQARGAQPVAEVMGAGASSDGHHMTQPTGSGAARAIALAMKDAQLELDTPLLISAHGTGTIANDRAEAAALRTVFGDALDTSHVIATKAAHGHLCGAVGALEFLIGLRALREQRAPAVLNYLERDPECGLPLVLKHTQDITANVLLSNSFAFGGLNSVLVGRAC